jgi:acetyl esterase/lipase
MESDAVAREIFTRTSGPVITVNYSLANGTSITYPTRHQEVAVATRWVLDNAEELDIDPAS